MKNFNSVPMVTMAQSAANWRNTYTHVDRTRAFPDTVTSTQLQPRSCAKQPAQLLQTLESNFYFEGIWGMCTHPPSPQNNNNIKPKNNKNKETQTKQQKTHQKLCFACHYPAWEKRKMRSNNDHAHVIYSVLITANGPDRMAQIQLLFGFHPCNAMVAVDNTLYSGLTT